MRRWRAQAQKQDIMRRDQGRIAIIAHRGDSHHHPDNSMAAYRAAIDAGADAIETDLRQTKDGIIYCHHDEIPSLNDDVVLFEDLLQLASGKIDLLLDLKIQSAEFARDVLNAVARHDMHSHIIMGVRSIAQARDVRAIDPSVRMLGFLPDPNMFADFFAVGGTIARLWEGDITQGTLSLAHGGAAHPVWIMTGFYPRDPDSIGNVTPDRLKALRSLDIQGILLNDPGLAREG